MSSIDALRSIAMQVLGAGNSSQSDDTGVADVGPNPGTVSAAGLFGNAARIAAPPAPAQQLSAPQQVPASQVPVRQSDMPGSYGGYGQDPQMKGEAMGYIDQGLKAANGAEYASAKGIKRAGEAYQNAHLALGAKEQEVYNQYVPQMADLAAKAKEVDDSYQQTVDTAQQQTTEQMKNVMLAAKRIQDYQFQDFWADKSTAGKVIGIIAQALSGAANGLAGQPGAPTPLDRIIERDMQLQMAKFNKEKGTYDAQSGVLQQMRGELGDVLSAQTAFRQGVNQKLQIMTQQMATQMNLPMEKAQEVAAQIGFSSATQLGNATKSISANIFNAALQKSGVAEKQAAFDLQSSQFHYAMAKDQEARNTVDGRAKAKIEASANAAIEFTKSADMFDQEMRNTGSVNHTRVKALALQLAEYGFRAQNPGTSAKLSDDVIHNYAGQAGIRFFPGTNEVAYVDPKTFAQFRATIGDQIKNQSLMAGHPEMYDQYRDETDRN